jgi:hypothetical protein
MFRRFRFGLSLISFTALVLLGSALYLILRGKYLLSFVLMIIAAIEAFIYMGGYRK